MAGLQDIPIRWPDQYDPAFFDRLFREVLSKADVRNAVEGTGITITGSSDDPATIAASDDVAALLGASIVTATDESGGDLTNVRQLAAGNFSILLQDNGPEGTLDISVGVINWGDLDDIPDLSVVGAPLVTTGFSEATFITSAAGGDDTVLSRVASVLDWTKFTAAMFPDSMVTALGSAAFDITTTLLTLTGTLVLTNTGAPDIVRLGMSALVDDDSTGAAFVGMLADGYAIHVPDAAGSIGLGTEGVVALLIDIANNVSVLGPATFTINDYTMPAADGALDDLLQTDGAGAVSFDSAFNILSGDFLYKPGIAGGQSANGGTASGDILALRGSADAGLGLVHIDSPLIFDFDYADTVPLTQNIISYTATVPASGAAVTAFIFVQPDITIDSGLFIPSTVRDIGTYRQGVAPGFATHTVFLGQPTLETTTATIQPNQSFMFASQALYENSGAGNVVTHVANIMGVSHLPRLGTRVSGDQLNVTNWTGLQVGAAYGTVAGTAISFGTIRGVLMQNPALGLFQPSAGTEAMDALIGLDVPAIAFGGNVTKVAVRSALVAATNTRFLQNLSTGASTFGTGVVHHSDSGVVQFGGSLNAADISLFWNAAGFLELFFWSTSDYLEISSPGADAFLFSPNAASGEMRFDFDRVAFGQSGSVGNQAFPFTQNARTVTLGGGYASALFTAGGNLNLGVLGMSDVTAWVVNALSFDNTAYSISELATFRVGGMTTSNPGGTVTERAALWVRGRTMLEGSVQYEPITPSALAAGNNNDWAGLLTGSASNNTRYWARVTGNATTSVLTGIDATAVQDGDTFELTNVGSDAISVTNQDAASSAANRIITPTGIAYTWAPLETIAVRYDTADTRWRLVDKVEPALATLHLSGDQFRKGATAPTDVTIGTTPTVPALLFDATNELASLYHSFPVDADLTQDMVLRLQFSLSSIEVNLDTCDFTCDYTAPTLVTAEGIAKASTQVTGQFTAVTGRLAVGDMYVMDITFSAADATNPLATAIGLAFEIHLTNVAGVADVHLVDGDLIYTKVRA